MYKIFVLFFSLCLVFQLPSYGVCQEKCADAKGEAAIINGDAPSAKMEAIARAKWAAIEKTVGTQVQAQSFVQNFDLVDDAIKTQAGGIIKSFRILGEENKSDRMVIRLNACVEPIKAREAVASMALNNSVAVFIPAKKAGSARRADEYEETSVLSEMLIEKLTDQGYKVVDVASTNAVDASIIESAMKTGNTLTVRSMMYKFLSNVIIIGKADYTVKTKKGEDIGYGIAMPFNNVTVRLTYRIVTKNSKTGNMEILTAGVEEGRGLSNSVEDAAAEGLKDLTEKLAPVLVDKIAKYIQGNIKKINVTVNGVTDIEATAETKQTLQTIVWVADVEEKGMGRYIVSYPENSLYLANSIKQKGNFKIVDFSPYSITVDYQK